MTQQHSPTFTLAEGISQRMTRRRLVGMAVAAGAMGIGITGVAAAHEHGSDQAVAYDYGSQGSDGTDEKPVKLKDGSWQVRITDNTAEGFQPGTITLKVGGAITWLNDDTKSHTATATDWQKDPAAAAGSQPQFATDDPLIATGAKWDTGPLKPGEWAKVTFPVAGTFEYACQFHPVMVGKVIVVSGDATPSAAVPPAVEIKDIAFGPATLNIAAGTTVTWTNNDPVPHTATGVDGSFDTGVIDPGATAVMTFDNPGTFSYGCSFHPNMAGTIVVS